MIKYIDIWFLTIYALRKKVYTLRKYMSITYILILIYDIFSSSRLI